MTNIFTIFRCIFILILTTFSLEAKSVILLPEYCVKDNLELKSNFFDTNQSNKVFPIISLPKTRSAFSVPTIDIKKKFEQNGYDVIDSSSGIIKFRKFCSLGGKEEEIASEILRLFEEKYPCIDADFPSVRASSALPHDFKTYEIKEIILSDNDYRNDKGAFQVIFTTPTHRDKKLYFRFQIDAKINVFKAKHNLHNDKILSANDYEMVQVTLNKLPSETITCSVPDRLMTKNYLRADSILTMQRFEYKKDVLRGATLRAFVRDGMLVIGTSAHVLQDANIGDVVKIKTDKGKLLNAKLISRNKAIVLE